MTPGWAEDILEPTFLRGLDRFVVKRRRGRGEGSGPSAGSSPRASGLEWVGNRRYQAGDDLRYLNWQLYARTGQPYTRSFRTEHAERLDIVIDRSASMTIGAPSKADVACMLAFSLGYVALASGERVGARCVADRCLSVFPAGRGKGHARRLLDFLVNAPGGRETNLGSCLASLSVEAREVGQVIVLSDLLDDHADTGLLGLARRGFQVSVLRLRSDCDEEPFAGDGRVRVEDIETGRTLSVDLTDEQRERFRRGRRDELEHTRRLCSDTGMEFAALESRRAIRDLVFEDLRVAGILG